MRYRRYITNRYKRYIYPAIITWANPKFRQALFVTDLVLVAVGNHLGDLFLLLPLSLWLLVFDAKITTP